MVQPNPTYFLLLPVAVEYLNDYSKKARASTRTQQESISTALPAPH